MTFETFGSEYGMDPDYVEWCRDNGYDPFSQTAEDAYAERHIDFDRKA